MLSEQSNSLANEDVSKKIGPLLCHLARGSEPSTDWDTEKGTQGLTTLESFELIQLLLAAIMASLS